MAANHRTQIKSYPTPLVQDVLFYEVLDASFAKHADFQKGQQHYDSHKWPHHILVDVQPLPDRGDKMYAFFYAAKRKDQDKYNWEHSKANLGGTRFDVITRSYVYLRDEYTPNTPALGSTMPNVPVDLFDYNNFHLIDRSQQRISERGRRNQGSIGSAELDSMFIIELHTYIDREEIVSSRYDLDTNGVLFTRQNIYIRGESYDDGVNPEVPIETAVADGSYWIPTSGGKLNSVEQVSDDVWVVTTQDLIPQSGLPTDQDLFGGTVLRVYQTSATYTWPAVLGDDGSGTGYSAPDITGLIAPTGIEIMDWEYKDGGSRLYPRVTYKRTSYRGPCRAEIHQEWMTQSQLDAANIDVMEIMEPLPITYPSPYLSINIPPTLHGVFFAQCDTGTNDPTWGQNVGSSRYFPETNYTDWPDSVVADIDVKPFRGGYLVTQVKIFKPNND